MFLHVFNHSVRTQPPRSLYVLASTFLPMPMDCQILYVCMLHGQPCNKNTFTTAWMDACACPPVCTCVYAHPYMFICCTLTPYVCTLYTTNAHCSNSIEYSQPYTSVSSHTQMCLYTHSSCFCMYASLCACICLCVYVLVLHICI